MFTEVRDQLRTWREDNTRHSEEVIDLWVYCLQHYKDRLGDERKYFIEITFFLLILFLFKIINYSLNDIANKV